MKTELWKGRDKNDNSIPDLAIRHIHRLSLPPLIPYHQNQRPHFPFLVSRGSVTKMNFWTPQKQSLFLHARGSSSAMQWPKTTPSGELTSMWEDWNGIPIIQLLPSIIKWSATIQSARHIHCGIWNEKWINIHLTTKQSFVDPRLTNAPPTSTFISIVWIAYPPISLRPHFL